MVADGRVMDYSNGMERVKNKGSGRKEGSIGKGSDGRKREQG